MVKPDALRGRTEVDVGFQSLAGTSAALAGMVGLDVDGLAELARGFSGLYFETGQGSAVTNGAAEGIDMVTLESRSYGLARYLQHRTGAWTIVSQPIRARFQRDHVDAFGGAVFHRGKIGRAHL